MDRVINPKCNHKHKQNFNAFIVVLKETNSYATLGEDKKTSKCSGFRTYYVNDTGFTPAVFHLVPGHTHLEELSRPWDPHEEQLFIKPPFILLMDCI